ncbi:MAG: N-6 DNA methylase [Cellulosilyticaceae bacterium]
MKKINLVKGYVSQVSSTKYSDEITCILSAVKVLVDKKDVDATSWSEVTRNQEKFISYAHKLSKHTGCNIFINKTFIKFINSLSEDEFKQLVNMLSEAQTTTDSLEIVNAYAEVRDNEKNYFEMAPNAVQVACELGDVQKATTIVDSFSFSANTLVGVSNYFKGRDTVNEAIEYYAVEKDIEECELAQLKAYLLIGNKAVTKCGDSLEKPILVEDDKLQQFDYALSVPPMGANQKINLQKDKYDRFIGLSSQAGNYISAWYYVEHMVKSCKEKAIVLLPIGALFSNRPIDKKIRKRFIEEDMIEGVIYLPNRIFSRSSVSTCWVIINKNKEESFKNKVMFIDLTESTEEISRRQCDVTERSIQEAKELYNNAKESDISFVVNKEWFEENDYYLDILDAIKREKALANVNKMPTVKLSSIAEIKRGVQVPKSRVDALKGDKATHYMITLGNIRKGQIILDETSMVEPEPRWKELYELEAGDIVITSKGNEMKVAMIGEEIKNAIVTANLFCIRVDKSKYSPEILRYYLESEKGMQLLESLTRGAMIKSLGRSDLEQLLVPNINKREDEIINKLIKRVEDDYKKDIEMANKRYSEGKISINEILGL